jgi:hypothetical protein
MPRLFDPEHRKVSFWARVNKLGSKQPNMNTNCWEWTGSKKGHGYGQMAVGKFGYYCHRYSYEITYGSIPGDLLVLHKCDNKACVRPDHLFLGTHKSNLHDAIEKGRHRVGVGIRQAWAKLDEQKVREIRAKYIPFKYSLPKLAKAYGVDQHTIWDVIHRVQWRHIA